MTKDELIGVVLRQTNDDSRRSIILDAVEAYSSASNDGKPIVSLSLPPRSEVEQWFTGQDAVPAEYWQEAPYRTNGDVYEQVYGALEWYMGGRQCGLTVGI